MDGTTLVPQGSIHPSSAERMIKLSVEAYPSPVLLLLSQLRATSMRHSLSFRRPLAFWGLKKIRGFFALHFSLAGNSGCLTLQEQRYPFLTVRAVFSCVQTKV